MSYATPFLLTIIEGKFGAGAGFELWRCTMKFPHTGSAPAGATIASFLAAISVPVGVYHQHTAVKSGNQTYLVSIAGANVGTDGKWLGGGLQETQRYTYADAVAGYGNGGGPPSQSLCVTLQTNRARGRGSKGRMYWPALAHIVESGSGRLSTADQAAVLPAGKALLDDVNIAADALFGASVGPLSVMSNLGAGTTGTVVAVGYGKKLDSQERREGKIEEAHIYSDLATTAAYKSEWAATIDDRIRDEIDLRNR